MAILLPVLLIASPVATGQQPAVGWSLEFEDPADLESAVVGVVGKNRVAAPPRAITDVAVRDGILRLGARFNADSQNDQYVTINWGDDEDVPGGQTASFEPISIADYPFIEIRWRRPAGDGDRVVQGNVIWQLCRQDGSLMTGYTSTPSRPSSSWQTETVRFAPDSAIPGPLTPVRAVGVRLELGAQSTRCPTAVEFDYIRIRAASPEERERERERVAPLIDYEAPPLPKHLRQKFVYAVFHAAPHVGGWTGQFDELVRMHVNAMHGPGPWHADIPHVARAAERAGVMIFPHSAPSPGQYEGTWASAGPQRTRETAEQFVAQTRDLDAIAGWFIADEPAVHKLIGVAGVKRILDEVDPRRVGLFVHFSIDRAKYFDRFTTIVMTDHYPIKGGVRDPWSVASWCRQIAEFTQKPHWFCPQAFGSQDWWKSAQRAKSFHGPTVEEFRLMMNLALANGTKGFFLFNYCHPEWTALADSVGNLTPLGQEAKRIGAQFHEVAPLLLNARPVFAPSVTVAADHRFSVAAMGDPEPGPLFLVAVNEDLVRSQAAQADIPTAWRSAERAVYDLESLTKVGDTSFGVQPLEPGAGRVYLLGTPAQFHAARQELLSRRVDERLRVQGIDRLIASNWGLSFQLESQYDPLVREARANVETPDACDRATAQLDAILAGQPELVACRGALKAAKEALGKANLAIHTGAKQPRAGCEPLVEPFERLCRTYSDLRRTYLSGNLAGWVDYREGRRRLVADTRRLADQAVKLLADAVKVTTGRTDRDTRDAQLSIGEP